MKPEMTEISVKFFNQLTRENKIMKETLRVYTKTELGGVAQKALDNMKELEKRDR
ncbi:hypothetical protein [Virgibacillus siamensis]|uniref:hypothetical protein n=1 Tax=Virgibacillus siamensis TaxID=480071 RepID=UPI0015884A97|nr:hypothetical protein [Virgibacillus siamensis]